MNLRPYQQDGVDGIREAYRTGHRSVLYQCPTGGGKTVIFSYIAANAAARGKRVCILVHRRELLKQAVAKLTSPGGGAPGVPCGVIAAGRTPNPWHAIQVASVDTLVNQMNNWHFDLIILDESHHAVASKWSRLLAHYKDAHILGVTATPQRLDGKGLDEHFTHLVHGPQVQTLITDGHLADYQFIGIPHPEVRDCPKEYGDFKKSALRQRMQSPKIIGDAVESYRKYLLGKPAIVFCYDLEHAERVAESFRAAGHTARRVDGKMSNEDRDDAFAGLASGRVQLLTSVDLVSEGLDVPNLAGVIGLRPTMSLTIALQQWGRCLRLHRDHPVKYIIDHVGNHIDHGTPRIDRTWTLDGVEKTAAGAAALAVTQCPQCYRVYEGRGECPFCGFECVGQGGRTIEEEAGDLVRINEERMAAEFADREKKAKKQEVWGAATREELERIAAERGYKAGWVQHMIGMRKKFGRPLREESAVA